MNVERRIIERLRSYSSLICSDLSDEEVLKIGEGTVFRAYIELDCAWQELKKEVKNAVMWKKDGTDS